MANITITQTCRSCQKPFVTTQGQAKWLVNKGLTLFKRCQECRDERRTNEKEEDVSDA